MAQTNYYIGKTANSAGESEINLRLYVSRAFVFVSAPEYGSTANAGARRTTSTFH